MPGEPTEALPKIARFKPYYAELEAGKSYFWCACGLSRNQPYCDGSHKDTTFQPVKYTASEAEEVLFCGCKHSAEAPFCDGTHNNLKHGDNRDDPDSAKSKVISEAAVDADGRARLDGNCFVTHISQLPHHDRESLRWAGVITQKQGSQYQSLFHLELPHGQSPVIRFDSREVILLLTEGEGKINISSQLFDIKTNYGIYVRAGEDFQLHNTGSRKLTVFAVVCPLADTPEFPDRLHSTFDHNHPHRTIGIDSTNRQSMADRFFQLLVNKTLGSNVVTQFIGEIPLSKAAPHRHLYEESLVILSGSGYMWTEHAKAWVDSGDVIFLPRKQLHSLECTDPEGMMVAGVIFPGNNPSINY